MTTRFWVLGCALLLLGGCEKPTAEDLFTAIKSQRLDRVESIAKKDPNLLKLRNSDGLTPLLVAAGVGNRGIVGVLLKAGSASEDRDGTGATPLHVAISKRHSAVAAQMVEGGANLAAPDALGRSALIHAASEGNDEIVRLLLKRGADLRATDPDGETALPAAIRSHKLDVVRTLVSAGADLNRRDRNGQKPVELAGDEGAEDIFEFLRAQGQEPVYDGPIHEAVAGGKTDVVRRLLSKKNAPADAEGAQGNRPLHFACLSDRAEIAKLLLEKGADAGAANGIGNTPLHVCSYVGAETIAAFLLTRNVRLDARNHKGETPLHLAAREGKLNVVTLLLRSGADAKIGDNAGETPLHEAVRASRGAVVSALLAAKAPVDARAGKGRTPLFSALDPEIVRTLLAAAASVNVRDDKGTGPLEAMVYGGCRPCTDLLLEKAASCVGIGHDATLRGDMAALRSVVEKAPALANEKDGLGQTPIHYAAIRGQAEAAEYLLSRGADPAAPSDLSPIHKAALADSGEVIAVLLAKGVNVDSQLKESEITPLHLAAREGDARAVKTLIEKGARVNALTIADETPLHLTAEKSLSLDVARLLIDAKVDRTTQNEKGETALDIAEWRAKKETDKPTVARAKEFARLIVAGPKRP